MVLWEFVRIMNFEGKLSLLTSLIASINIKPFEDSSETFNFLSISKEVLSIFSEYLFYLWFVSKNLSNTSN